MHQEVTWVLHLQCKKAKLPDLLEPLKVLSELCVQGRRCQLAEFAILVVALSVKEPIRDFVLTRLTHNIHDIL